jgi:hypothetical protein
MPPSQKERRTALEGAAEHGRIDMLQLLLIVVLKLKCLEKYNSTERRASLDVKDITPRQDCFRPSMIAAPNHYSSFSC